ncbi:ATP-binding protein [Actinopolymorpha pittospori]
MAARLGSSAEERAAAEHAEPPVVVIRPGDPSTMPAGIDPLRPIEGFPLQTHLDLVRALFLAAFDADEPFPQVLSAALTKAYVEQGWDVALGEAVHDRHVPRYPTLADLERCAIEVVDQIGYSREITDNVRGFVKVRLASLRLGTTGRFLEGGHRIDIGKLLERNVVLEIEDVGDDRDKAFLMGTVLIALTEHLRVAARRDPGAYARLRHLTVFEEAHRLLRRTDDTRGAAAHAVEMFAALLAEIRAYGEGLVVAEQIPAKLIPDVIKNTAVKIVHRLPARDDRDAVGATMNLSGAQSAYVVTLPPGEAAVFTDGMDNPLLVRVPDGTQRERRAADHELGGPALLSSPISGRCAAFYDTYDLPLTDHVRGQRLVQEFSDLRVFGELAVIAHLTNLPTPTLPEELRAELAARPPVVVKIAAAVATDEAVAARSGFLADRMRPDSLATHVADAMRARIRDLPTCEYDEPQWLARAFQLDMVYRRLRQGAAQTAREGAGDGAGDGAGAANGHDVGPRPELAKLIRLHDRTTVEQPNGDDQLAAVLARRREILASGAVEDAIFGMGRRSALEEVAGISRIESGWPSWVDQTTERLGAPWLAGYLKVPYAQRHGDGETVGAR